MDGRGNVLTGFDDPNMPSLLGMPLLGYKHYDPQVCHGLLFTAVSDLSNLNPSNQQSPLAP